MHLYKTNPSNEFIRILKLKFSKLWGKSHPSGMKPFSSDEKELGYWINKKKEFEAKITYGTKSADGPYLNFEIDHVRKEFIHDP